jgi:exportin-2 (importin alpha re-exporter)
VEHRAPKLFVLTSATAEAKLERAKETTPGFSLLLLNIVQNSELPLGTRQSGAVCFKNFMKFNYVVC